MSLSSIEAKYVEATLVACHVVWLRIILVDLTHEEEEPTPIFCDNNSAIAPSKNHVSHRKSKCIDTWFHFIGELVMNGEISLHFCKSQVQLVDIFTNPLA